MSYSYKNRQPYYVWGLTGTGVLDDFMDTREAMQMLLTRPDGPGSRPASDKSRGLVRRKPAIAGDASALPVLRYPATLDFSGNYRPAADWSPYVITSETAPVDRQMPWKYLAGQYGLTIAGELYVNSPGFVFGGLANASQWYNSLFPAFNRRNAAWGRMTRVRTPRARRPFRLLESTRATTYQGYGMRSNAAVVSRDGDIFLLAEGVVGSEEWQMAEMLIPVPRPPGGDVVFLDVVEGFQGYLPPYPALEQQSTGYIIVATTSDNKTYAASFASPAMTQGGPPPDFLEAARRLTEQGAVLAVDWTLLTGAVVNANISVGDSLWRLGTNYDASRPPPRLVVEPPSHGGRAATLNVLWSKVDYGGKPYWKAEEVYIVDPGAGYSDTPTVTLQPPPGGDVASMKPISLEVANGYITSSCGDDSGRWFCWSNGEIREVYIPPAAHHRDFFSPSFGTTTSGDLSLVPRSRVTYLFRETGSGPFVSANISVMGWGRKLKDWPAMAGDRVIAMERSIYWSEYRLGESGRLYKDLSLFSEGPWASLTMGAALRGGFATDSATFAAISRTDGGIYTWGGSAYLLGDGSTQPRATPQRIGGNSQWIKCHRPGKGDQDANYFVAIRKDDVCRSADQPMEYLPDAYYQR